VPIVKGDVYHDKFCEDGRNMCGRMLPHTMSVMDMVEEVVATYAVKENSGNDDTQRRLRPRNNAGGSSAVPRRLVKAQTNITKSSDVSGDIRSDAKPEQNVAKRSRKGKGTMAIGDQPPTVRANLKGDVKVRFVVSLLHAIVEKQD